MVLMLCHNGVDWISLYRAYVACYVPYVLCLINSLKVHLKIGQNLQTKFIFVCFPGEQSEQITKETETHREGAEGRNTAQFNQLGDVDESHFYAYFMTMVVICIVGYLVFHNKQKVCNLEEYMCTCCMYCTRWLACKMTSNV